MDSLDERLAQVQAHLAELLAAGWAAGGPQRTALAAEASAMRALGVTVLANRLDELAAARTAREALRSVALGLRACHLLRLRLADDRIPGGGWRPVCPGDDRPPSRLLPVAPVQLAGVPRWACARLRDGAAEALVLVEPVNLPADVAPWLGSRHLLRARLRWTGRRPYGTATVDEYRLVDPSWIPTHGASDDPLAAFREHLARGRVADGTLLAPGASELRLTRLKESSPDAYLWLDPSLRQALWTPTAFQSGVWTVCWTGGGTIPLAQLVPSGLMRKETAVVLPDGAARPRFER